jgi:hypothetical protein
MREPLVAPRDIVGCMPNEVSVAHCHTLAKWERRLEILLDKCDALEEAIKVYKRVEETEWKTARARAARAATYWGLARIKLRSYREMIKECNEQIAQRERMGK